MVNLSTLATETNGLWIILFIIIVIVVVTVTIFFAFLERSKNRSLHSKNIADLETFEKLKKKDIEIASLQSALEQIEYRCEKQQAQLRSSQDLAQTYANENTKLKAIMQEQQKHIAHEKSLVEEAREALLKEFELSANRLFEQKQKSFTEASRVSLESTLKPFKEKLGNFNQRIEDMHHKDTAQRGQLFGQINELQKQTRMVSEEANNLASALKGDNKTQGNWGEVILEQILSSSGLEKGREYKTQLSFRNQQNALARPDVVVYLPENRQLIIDSKVSLASYEAYSSSSEQDKRDEHLKKHLDSLKRHVRDLSSKSYESIAGLNTVDFVFLFVPIEAAFIDAVRQDPSLFKWAYDFKIVLVSPSSLMSTLRTVEMLWQYDKQNRNAELIADEAGKLYDKFIGFMESLERAEEGIVKARDQLSDAKKKLSTGRGSLVKRTENLRKLGAKTKKEPSSEYSSQLAEPASLTEPDD